MSGRTLSLPCGVKGVLYVSKGQRWCAICVATVEPETWPTWINSSAVVAGGGPMNNKLVGIIVQGKTSQRMTKRQKDLSHHRSIHQWFSDQACTATSQVLILGRQNYTITITEKTRLFLRLRNIPPFPYYHENPRVPWWRWGSFILCTRTEGPKETPDISKGVIRTYCFWLEEFAVSIFKHTYRKKNKVRIRQKQGTKDKPSSSYWYDDWQHPWIHQTRLNSASRETKAQEKRERTQASYRTTNRLPERQKQTNSRERLLSSTQRPWILFLIASMRRLIIRLHFQLQRCTVMFKQQLSKVPSLREMILEYNFGPKSDMSTELVPSRIALDQGMLQSLWTECSIFSTRIFVWRGTQTLSHLVERLQRLDTHTRSIVLLFRFDKSIFKFFQRSTLSRHTKIKLQIAQWKKNALLFLLFLKSISNRLDQLFQFSYRTRILNSFTILKSTVRPIL